ncbi:MAG: UvrD-helicase domain-containing protein [Thiolinea sp.]
MAALLPLCGSAPDPATHVLEQLRYELLVWLREQLPQRKRQAGLLAFDDLLVNLQEALQARPELAVALARQYPVALIDEFQDTDPVQFAVFEQIYGESDGQLYYVGDPKQAIYSFAAPIFIPTCIAADTVNIEQQYNLTAIFAPSHSC